MYCSVSDVRSRNILITQNLSDTEVIETILVTESKVNGYLKSKCTLPLSSVPGFIRELTADLAAANLIISNVGNRGSDDAPEQAKVYLQKAQKVIDDIKSGDLQVVDNVGQAIPSPAGVIVSVGGKRSVFSSWDMDNPRTFKR